MLPAWLEVNRLRQELQELSVPEGFPADGKERFEKLQEEIDRLGNELAEQTDAITDIEPSWRRSLSIRESPIARPTSSMSSR